MPKAAKRNSDHARRHNTPNINNEAISQQLEALLTPAIFAVQYFAAKENQDLGVVKSLRKPVSKLDLSPFPAPS